LGVFFQRHVNAELQKKGFALGLLFQRHVNMEQQKKGSAKI
jgi:hypothetical protein